MRIHCGRKSLLLLLVSSPVMAQGKYPDPDSAATEEAARKALEQKHIVDIVGVTSGIQSVLQDLGAKVVGQQLTIDLAADVLFDFDKYTLRPRANDTLRKVGQVAASFPNSPMLIEGHTDGKGTHPYNMKLSENRADAVKNWLVQNASIAGSRITTQGWGETKPVVPNTKPDGSDDPDGRQKNRRVEIVLTQTGPMTGP